MSSQFPLGIAPLFFVRPDRSDSDRAKPFKVRKYRKSKLNTRSTTSFEWAPLFLCATGDARNSCDCYSDCDEIDECYCYYDNEKVDYYDHDKIMNYYGNDYYYSNITMKTLY
jgi:hypothetical protein